MTKRRTAGFIGNHACFFFAAVTFGIILCYGGTGSADIQDTQEPPAQGVCQENSNDADSYSGNMLCGPISLTIALKRHGVDISLDEAIRLTETRGEGTTMLGLKLAVEAKGLKANGYKNMTSQELLEIGGPAIILANDSHFFVVESGNESNFIIFDYPKEPHLLSREEFEKIWGGVALVVVKPEMPPPPEKKLE